MQLTAGVGNAGQHLLVIVGNAVDIVHVAGNFLAGVQLFVALIANLPRIIVEVVKAVPQIISGLVRAFTGYISSMAQVGGNLIKGLWNGISDAGAWLWSKISGFFGNVVSKIKNFFGINSPSTLFAGIGRNMGEGIGVGFEDAMTVVSRDMQNAVPTNFDLNYRGQGQSGQGGAAGTSITQNLSV